MSYKLFFSAAVLLLLVACAPENHLEESSETQELITMPKLPVPKVAPPSPTPVPLPQPTCNSLSVGAIKLKSNDYSPENLLSKIKSLLKDYPAVDLIVTPEYALYGRDPGQDFRRDPVLVSCNSDGCRVSSIGTAKSDTLVQTVNSVQSLARQYKVNIVLGTVATRRKVFDRDITFNTQLIIDKQGNLLAEHLAAKQYDFFSDPYFRCDDQLSVCQEIYRQSLATVKTFNLSSRNNVNFKIAPVICGEMIDSGYADKLAGQGVDLVVNSNFDQDCQWEDETEMIFAKYPAPIGPFGCWPEIIQRITNLYDSKKLIKANSYLLVSDGLTAQSGIISFRRTPPQSLALRADYVYGVIRIGDC